MTTPWSPLSGETPIDVSGLKAKGVGNRRDLNIAEAQNILKATLKYLARRPSKRLAPFDYAWSLRLHRAMFGDVWKWAGQLRTRDLNIGLHWQHVEPAL